MLEVCDGDRIVAINLGSAAIIVIGRSRYLFECWVIAVTLTGTGIDVCFAEGVLHLDTYLVD